MPPHLLQIFRERLKPGTEAQYTAIEDETCRLCAELGCPHPFLGSESLTGPKEGWFFNGYESREEHQDVVRAYSKNTPLLEALMKNSERKAALTHAPVEVFATFRPDVSRGPLWTLGMGRFLMIRITNDQRATTGTVFEAPDGTRFVVNAAQTGDEADRLAASVGPESIVCGVRPRWSFPAPEWVAGDTAFWQQRTP